MSEVLTPTVQNLTLTTHDTEYSLVIPAGCQFFQFKCRTANAIRYAFVTGKVAASTSPFMTLASGEVFRSPEKLSMAQATLYFGAATTDGLIVEFIGWTKVL